MEPFKIGQPVKFNWFDETVHGVVVDITPTGILVRFEEIDWTHCFTIDGRFTVDWDVELCLEED